MRLITASWGLMVTQAGLVDFVVGRAEQGFKMLGWEVLPFRAVVDLACAGCGEGFREPHPWCGVGVFIVAGPLGDDVYHEECCPTGVPEWWGHYREDDAEPAEQTAFEGW